MPSRRRAPTLLPTWALGLLALFGCGGNACIETCQDYELYLKECGYGWSTAFPDKGWASIDDCYDDNWDVTADQEATCESTSEEYRELPCY